MAKAIGLLSGGLDSILAIKMLLEQDIDVIGVCFTSPFFDNSEYAKSITDKQKKQPTSQVSHTSLIAIKKKSKRYLTRKY